MLKKVVETKLRRFCVDTKLRRLGVETCPARFAVDTKLSKLGVETTPGTEDRYPTLPRLITVEASCVLR